MKKNVIKSLVLPLLLFSLAACGNNANEQVNLEEETRQLYELALKAGFNGTYEEWLETLKGPQGEKGDKGDKGDPGQDGKDGTNGKDGVDGKDGKDGVDGKDGKDGKDGVDGTNGTNGTNGTDGAPGTNGLSLYSGNGAPSPLLGAEGDSYIDVLTYTLYKKENTGWVSCGSFKGVDGEPGEDGEPGQNGLNGSSILTGEANPNIDDGQNGDVYINTSSFDLFVKTNGDWILKGNIQGATGSQGPQGEPGAAGAAGGQGPQGEKGDQGEPGENGQNGKSAYEIYLTYHPEYSGSEEQWIEDLVGGHLGQKVTVTFVTGKGETVPNQVLDYRGSLSDVVPDTPQREYHTGHWAINDEPVADIHSVVFTSDTTVVAVYDDCEFVVDGSGKLTSYLGTDSVVNVPRYALEQEITSIGTNAFKNKQSITSITLPNSVTEIEPEAFTGCSNLDTLNIPSSVSNIDPEAARGSGLQNYVVDNESIFYSSIDGVLFSKDGLVLKSFPAGRTGSYAVPDGTTSIALKAFAYHSGITSVTLPDSVTALDTRAFTNCNNLEEISLNEGLETIGTNALSYCSKLEELIIPSTVTSYGGSCFVYDIHLETLTVQPGGALVPTGSLLRCDALDVVANSASIAFHYNGDLSHDENTHWRTVTDSGFTSLKFDEEVHHFTDVDHPATYDNDRYITHTCEECGYTYDEVFENSRLDETASLSVLSFSLSDDESHYIVTNKQNVTLGDVYIPRTYEGKPVSELKGFYEQSTLTSIYLPDSITKTSKSALNRCSNLTTIRLPSGEVEYGDDFLDGTSNITPHVIDANGNKYLGPESNPYYFLYKGNKDLTSVTINSNVKEILINAFNYGDMQSLTIPGGVHKIHTAAFSMCTYLTSITFGSVGVDIIGMNAFYACSALEEVTINATTSLDPSAFTRCQSLTAININPSNPNYSSIDGVVYNKDQTTLVIVPEGIEGTITLPNTVTTIGYYAAEYNPQNTVIHTPTIIIPTSVTFIDSLAFADSYAHIIYMGNESQWNAIPKEDDWNHNYHGGAIMFNL